MFPYPGQYTADGQPIRNTGFGAQAYRWYRYRDLAQRAWQGRHAVLATAGKAVYDAFASTKKQNQLTKVRKARVNAAVNKYRSGRRALALKALRTPKPTPPMPRNSRVLSKRRAVKRRPRIRKRLSKKRRIRGKRMFSSVGFKHRFHDMYTLDVGTTPATLTGYSTGADFTAKFIRPYINSTATGAWTNLGDYTTASTRFIYGRVFLPLTSLYETDADMRQCFNKCKINKVKMTFQFPDQEAGTTNTDFPVMMYVNYRDMRNVTFISNAAVGDTSPPTNVATWVDAMFERPGWKRYAIKRANKVTVTFTPRPVWIKDILTAAGAEENRTMIGSPSWANSSYQLRNLGYLGPTIAFRTNAPASYPHTVASNFDATPFLKYTTVRVDASVSWKGIDYKAHDGATND